MPRLRAFADGLALVALGLWLGVVVMSGLVAAISFPIMKSVSPSLAEFSAYPGEHWPIAAGHIARRVFDIGAVLQGGCAAISCLMLAVSVWADSRRPRPIQAVRTIALLLAVGTLAYWRLSLSPTMDHDLDAFWAAAKAGNTELADTHKAAFNTAHPIAARALSFLALFIAANIFEVVRTIYVTARRPEKAA